MASQQIYASRGGQNFKPYSIAKDAPLQPYNIAGHNINTHALNDTSGQQWYLTDGGNWRNTATKALSPTAPSYQATAPAALPAAAPTPAAATPTPTSAAPQQFRSIWDFAPAGTENLFGPNNYGSLNYGSVQDHIPQNWSPSPLHNFQVEQGNKSLSKQLSAKGLIGSGVEDEMRADISARASAEESQRLMEMARDSYAANNQSKLEQYRTGVNETNSLRNLITNLMSTDYGAYQGGVEADKDRQLSKDGQNLDLFSRVLGFMETLNPMQYGFPATTEGAKMQSDLGKQLSGILMTPSGGGGGGGGIPALPPYRAPGAGGGSFAQDLSHVGGGILPLIQSIFDNDKKEKEKDKKD